MTHTQPPLEPTAGSSSPRIPKPKRTSRSLFNRTPNPLGRPPTSYLDPKSGFITSDHSQAFNARKKILLIQYLTEKPFRIRDACKFVGVDYVTYYSHMKSDLKLRSEVSRVKALRIEEVEQKLADCAVKEEKTIDRIFFLKTWKPERYNPVSRVEYSSSKVQLSSSDAQEFLARQSAIEAEIVEEQNKLISDGNDTTICSLDGDNSDELNSPSEETNEHLT